MKTIRILPEAERDLECAADFYERCGEGLGKYFIDCLISDIESFRLYAGVHQCHHGFFRCVSKRFPFSIYYLMVKESVEIYAVLDCRRRPDVNICKVRTRSKSDLNKEDLA